MLKVVHITNEVAVKPKKETIHQFALALVAKNYMRDKMKAELKYKNKAENVRPSALEQMNYNY